VVNPGIRVVRCGLGHKLGTAPPVDALVTTACRLLRLGDAGGVSGFIDDYGG
jgi:hypothetical protein